MKDLRIEKEIRIVVTVTDGDTLSGIAGMLLGNPDRWPEIYNINPTVQDPDRIFPGMVLIVPVMVIPPKEDYPERFSRPRPAGESPSMTNAARTGAINRVLNTFAYRAPEIRTQFERDLAVVMEYLEELQTREARA